MFEEDTVFILGAGASNPYGYPLGSSLIEKIINNIEEDSIYLPISVSQSYSKCENFYKLDEVIQCRELYRDMVEDAQLSHQDTRFEHKSIFYKRYNLRDIEEFNNLKNRLHTFSPTSIDSFLSHNKSFSKAGKIMIVYSLLKNEDKDAFSGVNQDNWYSLLLNDLIANCADKPSSLLENKLDIITFNYDISLDFCIKKKLLSIESFKNKVDETDDRTIATKYLEEKLKIYHVYGDLNRFNELDNYGRFYSDSLKKENDIDLNCKRFSESLFLAENIRIIYEERREKDKELYYNIIKKAKNIVFIGFGFDRDNLDQLGLPRFFFDWEALLRQVNDGNRRRISVKWLNYKNKMTGLSRQFDGLDDGGGLKILNSNQRKIEIIESIAENISDAYQYDFKLFLY